MALITLPSPAYFKSVDWTLQQPAQVNKSPYSGARHVMVMGATRFSVAAAVIPITREAAVRPWRAFLAALQGPVNTFRMPAYNIVPPSGNPTVGTGGAAAGASSVPTAGSQTALKGSYATIALAGGLYQLVILTADLAANGSMAFQPPLRAAASAGAAIELLAPFGEVALVSDSFTITGTEGQGFGVTFEAEEAY